MQAGRSFSFQYAFTDDKISIGSPTSNNDIISAAPDFPDWVSEDHRIIGATRVASTQRGGLTEGRASRRSRCV
jgi:hypothetical protein